MKPHEVLYEIYIPTTQENEFVKQFKQARRREDDIAIVTAGTQSVNCYSLKCSRTTAAEWDVHYQE